MVSWDEICNVLNMAFDYRDMFGHVFDSCFVAGVLPAGLLVRLSWVGGGFWMCFSLSYGTRDFLPSYPVY